MIIYVYKLNSCFCLSEKLICKPDNINIPLPKFNLDSVTKSNPDFVNINIEESENSNIDINENKVDSF